MAARAWRLARFDRWRRRPGPRARRGRLAGGRSSAGGRLAVVPGHADAAHDQLGSVGSGHARAGPGQDLELAGPHRPEPRAGGRARATDAGQGAPGARCRDPQRGGARPVSDAGSDTRGIVRAGQPAADAAAPSPEHVLAGAALIRGGRMYRLARPRFPKMPLWPGHPTFEVVSYRTPHGSRVTGDHHWGLPNDACLGFMSELVIGTTHTGAHIDAHAHMTVGPEDRWHGGSARTDLGDFGPVIGDACEIPPLWRRGVLYDVPGHRGVTALTANEPITADELLAIEEASGGAPGAGDVALVRTGYLR